MVCIALMYFNHLFKAEISRPTIIENNIIGVYQMSLKSKYLRKIQVKSERYFYCNGKL
jgi:hypothetical protein